jgi:CRISPR-associated protein (TIGR02584 family)
MKKAARKSIKLGANAHSPTSLEETVAKQELAPSAPPGQQEQLVLLAVVGMSPAILTETVWALAHESPPVIPDRVVVVTTTGGRQVIDRELLTPVREGSPDLWQELRKAILGSKANLDGRLMLDPPRLVEAPNTRTGRMDCLEDLRTPKENEATANFLMAELRRWTETPDTRLIVSIAGGRKTMGALLYGCVSLVGHENDRLTHVLVTEPFDDPRLKPKFYFPAQSIQELKTADGRKVQARNATIQLADIPFVAFRNLFKRDLVKKPSSFTELVQRCRNEVGVIARRETRLVLWRSKTQISVNGVVVPTSVREHLLLLFLAEHALSAKAPFVSYAAAYVEFNEFSRRVYEVRPAADYNDWRHEAQQNLNDTSMERMCVRAKNQLKEKLERAGPQAELLYHVLPEAKRFSLDLAPDRITIRD